MTKRSASAPKRNDTPRSFRFSDDELALLDRMAGQHGGTKKAVMAGLEALEGKGDVDVAEALRRLADQLEARK